jgi:hypothetical protein
MRKPKKKRNRIAGAGAYVEFHGSFSSEAKADKKARARHGFYVKRVIPGIGRRFIVMTKREAPF